MNSPTVRRAALAVALITAFASTSAQQPPKDDAYWKAYAATLPSPSTVHIRLKGGRVIRGTLIAANPGDILIRVKRVPFLPRIERRVRYDNIEELKRTHPYRTLSIVAAAAAVSIMVFLASVPI